VDGRAPRGPRRAVGGTRQSARGTWAVAGRAEVGSGGPGRSPVRRMRLGVRCCLVQQTGQLALGPARGRARPLPGKILDTPELASWWTQFWTHPNWPVGGTRFWTHQAGGWRGGFWTHADLASWRGGWTTLTKLGTGP
jgi:hypothetical protein